MKKKLTPEQKVKLNLSRETLRRLEEGEVKQVAGGSQYPCVSTGPCPLT